ncbi:type VI secretion lipoprotein TssJ [Thiotrichales bacterium 19S3-7]|nr:type VI secretion lipoprotein TssJ [Thiotrichales bacterium 19S3-7]MCF6802140.1 type VI secretion lipoprotein TssJ [Thiotrichales bacterium 19S3-11]
MTRKNADWSYTKDAITINLTADKQLNVYDNYSHALAIGIAQVSSPDKYAQILQTRNGLATVIANEKPVQGQTSFKRISMQPGEQQTLVLDRAYATEYVYLFFGYAQGILDKNSYLVPIPLDGTPQPLNIKVELGPTYIVSINHS